MLFFFVGLFWGSQTLARSSLDDSENHWSWSLVFFFKKTCIYIFIVCVRACMCTGVWTQACHCRLWELALLFLMWILGIELGPSACSESTFTRWSTSPGWPFFCYCHSVYLKRNFFSWSASKRESSKYPAMIKQLTNSMMLFCSISFIILKLLVGVGRHICD